MPNDGAGNDYLSGGEGNDIAYGGDGDDLFAFGGIDDGAAASGMDTFSGGGGWTDTILLDGMIGVPTASAGWTMTVDGGGAYTENANTATGVQNWYFSPRLELGPRYRHAALTNGWAAGGAETGH